jgi:hypothetical protein
LACEEERVPRVPALEKMMEAFHLKRTIGTNTLLLVGGHPHEQGGPSICRCSWIGRLDPRVIEGT